MPETFFATILSVTLTASGSGSPSYAVPNNEGLTVSQIRFIASGAFSITGIKTSDGYLFTNASVNNPILSTHIQNAASPNFALQNIDPPIEIKGSLSLIIDLLDTSAAPNTVRILLTGKRITP